MDDRRTFLGVEKSITGRRWVEKLDASATNRAKAIAEQCEMDEIIARILAARGVEAEEAESFLKPTLRDLMPDPDSITDMEAAANRLATAVSEKEKIGIFGDYDVDGATSAALVAGVLENLGLEVQVHIPDRILEGYGPNASALRALIDDGAKLLVLVDCGSSGIEALETAREAGIDVIVLDHHQVGDAPPQVAAFVNPNREDDLSGLGHLCAAGICFMAMAALLRRLREKGFFTEERPEPDLMRRIDLAALGTVCDIVPLTGLNRAFVVRGLEAIRRRSNLGIAELCAVAKMNGPANAWSLGFLLGPRINAGGRIGNAALGVKLLMSENREEARKIAEQLDELNQKRRAIEAEMTEQALAEAQAEMGAGESAGAGAREGASAGGGASASAPNVLIMGRETWHQGIVGLLASRLKERFQKPAFAVSFDQNGMGTGSGRSVSGIDLGKIVRQAVEEGVLEKGGGHAMAAGISVKRENMAALRAFMEEKCASEFAKQERDDCLEMDAALSARAARPQLCDLMEQAGPYGAGNPQPVLAFPNHAIQYAKRVGRDHVRFTIAAADGAKLNAIGFGIAEEKLGKAILDGRGKKAHFAGYLNAEFYRGGKNVQLRLIDMGTVD